MWAQEQILFHASSSLELSIGALYLDFHLEGEVEEERVSIFQSGGSRFCQREIYRQENDGAYVF